MYVKILKICLTPNIQYYTAQKLIEKEAPG